jgi:hypothetical protein
MKEAGSSVVDISTKGKKRRRRRRKITRTRQQFAIWTELHT